MSVLEQLQEALAEVEADERLHYPPALVEINAPLALIQVALKTRQEVLHNAIRLLEAERKSEASSFTLAQLQAEMAPWVEHNFGKRPSWHPLLGIMEELGELTHAHLKCEQGIRGTPEEHFSAKIDAVADVVIFLADYCSAEGIDLQQAVEGTWAQVRQRDWKKAPIDGES
jgi:NTP pyrophosphatase (non-canonical NTP hydrolase)